MQLRCVLYGYRKYKLDYTPIPEEAEIVKWIFAEYIKGRSLKSIANDLSERQVIYYKDRTLWSKNAIKRILENEHYMGDAEYQEIVDKKTFNKAKKILLGKGGSREKESEEVSFLKQICFCENCGKHFGYRTNPNGKRRWMCSNRCKCTEIFLDDKTVYGKINELLVKVICDPEILKVEKNKKENELPRELLIEERNLRFKFEDILSYSFKALQKTTYDLMGRKFEYMDIDYSKDITERLIEYIKGYSIDIEKEIDIQFLKVTVSKIVIKNSGEFIIHFINGKEISKNIQECIGVNNYEW